jgi:hypothetical protein
MEQITQTEAIKRIKENKETFILYPDGTEATAETKAEIIAAAKNGLKFGFEDPQQNHIQDQYQEQRLINKFFNWFKILGGNVANFKADEIAEQFQEPKFFVSTFKNRAEEVKQKYNHKFTFDI